MNITWVCWKLWFQILNLGHRCIIDCQNCNQSLCGNIMALIETILMVKHVELKIWSTYNKTSPKTQETMQSPKTKHKILVVHLMFWSHKNNENETLWWTMRKYGQTLIPCSIHLTSFTIIYFNLFTIFICNNRNIVKFLTPF